MLPEFKKRIDTLRDILVGAVPSPAGQIEQITYALIYKFMSDIDDQAASIPGGRRTYFTGEYEKYGWHELMAPTLGAHERLILYREALGSLAKNPGLPELFQGIYQNAYLTFNDPRVLTLFLKELDNFKYSNSDDIGDAYEYLLQITGAQGDVGQFRTPRHIIKFIVEAVNPTKSDSVLDPAVGTAGFLIGAYNHVKHHHDGIDEISGLPSEEEERLTSDELDKLHKSYHGFDIDPTMVRTSKVNMYLHDFKTPDIKNHDSLSNDDYWNEQYDVILANPPFMSPKGGIKPHNKFGIIANRAEVLFVDYIASHLKPTGRAGIVVPEGIIFQSGKAYKELRKNLVNNYLYAVVSLPAGVFQPYSGVKTSVLLLDKDFSKQRNEVLFVKIDNDGYSLGSQRRETNGSQFPEALELIKKFKEGKEISSDFAHSVSKELIVKSDDYNLSGDRYLSEVATDTSAWPIVEVGKYLDYVRGLTYSKSDETNKDASLKVLRANNINLKGQIILDDVKTISTSVRTKETQKLRKNDIFICSASGSKDHVGKVAFIDSDTGYFFGGFMAALRTHDGLDPKYLFYYLRSEKFNLYLRSAISGSNINNLNSRILGAFKIPLPPVEIQRKISAELDGYQKIIDAAQAIVNSYKPIIKINPNWKYTKLGDVFEMVNGRGFKTSEWSPTGLPIVRIANLNSNDATYNYYDGLYDEKIVVNDGDLLFSWSGTRGTSFGPHLWRRDKGLLNQHIFKMNAKNIPISLEFAYFYLKTIVPAIEAKAHGSGGLVHITKPELNLFEIPTPPIEEQQRIVDQLQFEQELVNTNIKLSGIFQQKVKDKIAEVWGE